MKSLIGVFLVATLCALSARLFLVEDYRISSNSMDPSLLQGDLVFVSKSAYNLRLPFSNYELVKLRRPHRFEVVAFTLPDSGIETFVKRVVALGGDRILIRDGRLFINDVQAHYLPDVESKVSSNDSEPTLLWESTEHGESHKIQTDRTKASNYGPVDVPKDYFFVLGDNRTESVDSRTWGPIPYSCLKGRVALVWLSINPLGGFRKERVGIWPNG